MTAKLPYMVSPGLVAKILNKLIEAKTPDRFTSDFLNTKLGFTGGSAAAFIPLIKRIGLLNGDGTPTTLYSQFRAETSRGLAMAEAIRKGYSELFDRNQYANDLDPKGLADLVSQVSGAEKGNKADQSTVATFLALKAFADFDAQPSAVSKIIEDFPRSQESFTGERHQNADRMQARVNESVGMNLSYTINLNLPETTDPEVFNAIFRALNEHILKK